MENRRFYWKLDREATARADEELARRHPDLKGQRLSALPDRPNHNRDLSKEWIDLYERFGGHVNRIGNSRARLAPIGVDAALAREVDEALWSKFPELKRRKLTFGPEDARYREAWIDIFVSLGGKVARICANLRLPSELVER
jgi:hypothetical protein